MTMYWILFLIPALRALLLPDRGPQPGRQKVRLTPGWLAVGIFLVAMIGFRYRVGGDWYNYLGHLADARGRSLGELLAKSDPGYRFMSWLSLALDWDIYGVNTLGALIFTCGLVAFCRTMQRPWLALAVAVPYLVTVVAMGYTRQGIALGFAMLGLVALARKSTVMFVVWVLLGAMVHRSALLLLPIAALATPRNRIWVTFWVGALFAVGYLSLIDPEAESLYTNYIARGYESQGALVRLSITAIAAILFLILRRRFALDSTAKALWTWISLLSLLLPVVALASPNISTAVDRMGLYLLPLQLFVFSSLPNVIGSVARRKVWVVAILAYYATILFVWLHFADNAYAWLPYRFFFLEPAA
jgi:hypothetical protein